MSQTGRNTGGMVDPAMGAGGPAMDTPDDVVVEIEGQAPNLGDEAIQDLVLQMNEDGSAEFIDPSEQGQEVLAEESTVTQQILQRYLTILFWANFLLTCFRNAKKI